MFIVNKLLVDDTTTGDSDYEMYIRVSSVWKKVLSHRKYAALTVLFTIILIYYIQNEHPCHPEHCHGFPYAYPLSNIQEIVNDVIKKGHTSVKPIYNMSGEYHFIHNVSCSLETELVIIVKSYVANFNHRMDIRSTWGKCHDKTVKIIFTLGFSSKYVETVKEEHMKYKDIIQCSFIDKYKHNIYKTIMSYNWVVSSCWGSHSVFFVDDDYFVNIPNIIQFVYDHKMELRNTMFGHKQCFRKPSRLLSHKGFISEDEYPFDILPPFLSGGSILTHISVVRKLQIAFPFMKQIHLDDLYISIVAQQLNITLTNECRLANEFERRTDVEYIMSSHDYGNRLHLYQAWRKINAFCFFGATNKI